MESLVLPPGRRPYGPEAVLILVMKILLILLNIRRWTFDVHPFPKVSMPVIVVTDALFLEILQKLYPAFHKHL